METDDLLSREVVLARDNVQIRTVLSTVADRNLHRALRWQGLVVQLGKRRRDGRGEPRVGRCRAITVRHPTRLVMNRHTDEGRHELDHPRYTASLEARADGAYQAVRLLVDRVAESNQQRAIAEGRQVHQRM